jgi:hypothetical protein
MASSSIDLPGSQNLPSISYTQNSVTVDSEQYSLSEPPATTGSITASGAGNSIAVDVTGMATVIFDITGTYSGLIAAWEGSLNGGSTYTGLQAYNMANGVSATAITANATYGISCAGLTHVRLNPLVLSSGTVSVRALPSAGVAPQPAPISTPSEAASTATGFVANTQNLMFDGNALTWSFMRSNFSGTAIASGARTATNNSSDLNNNNARGVTIMLNVTSAGTGSIQVNVQGKDPVSAGYYKLAADPTAVTTAALFVYEFYPGASTAAAGGVTARTACSLPRTFRVIVTHGNANSMTYSVGYSLIL